MKYKYYYGMDLAEKGSKDYSVLAKFKKNLKTSEIKLIRFIKLNKIQNKSIRKDLTK